MRGREKGGSFLQAHKAQSQLPAGEVGSQGRDREVGNEHDKLHIPLPRGQDHDLDSGLLNSPRTRF